MVEPVEYEPAVRCFLAGVETCVKSGVAPHALHEALAPYFSDLLVVATRGAFRQTGAPVAADDLQVCDPARCAVSSGRFSANVTVAASLLTAVVTLGASRPPHVIESFCQLQDLQNAIEGAQSAGAQHCKFENEHY
jgi:hypothetical protein